MDYKKNEKYFKGGSTSGLKLGIGLLLIGLVLCFVDQVLIGILLMLVGVAAIYFLFIASGIKDSDIDAACMAKISDITDQALRKLGLDEDEVKEAEPIIVHGYDLRSANMRKIGKDGVARSSEYDASVFFFSQDQVHCYHKEFSLIKDESLDGTEEYFYRDIVASKVTQERIEISNPRKKGANKTETIAFESFVLTTSGGTSVSAVFKASDKAAIDRSLAAMRNLLKTKKQALS